MLPALISGNLKLFTILKILDEEKLTLHPLTEDLKKVGIVSIITPENFSKLSPENITVVDAKDENYQLLTTLGFNAAQNKDKLNFTQQPKKQSQEKGKEKEKEKKEREISTDHLIKTDFQIPFPKVSHKKEELIKKINLAITGSQHVIDPQTQEIFDYSLRKDLLKRVDNSKTKYSFNTDSYLGWSYKNATGFRLTHWSHGKNGRDRAKEFLQFVNHPHTSYVEIIDRLVLLCKDSSDNNHSLSTFIYEQFKDNPNFMDLMSKVKKEKQSEKINSHIYKYCQKK